MAGINEELWNLPTDVNFKVMGRSQHPLTDIVIEIVKRHAPDFDEKRILTCQIAIKELHRSCLQLIVEMVLRSDCCKNIGKNDCT